MCLSFPLAPCDLTYFWIVTIPETSWEKCECNVQWKHMYCPILDGVQQITIIIHIPPSIGEISVNFHCEFHNGGVTGDWVVKDLGSRPRVMGSSPTSGMALFFPFPRVYSALPQKYGGVFTPSFGGDIKPLILGDLVQISLPTYLSRLSPGTH